MRLDKSTNARRNIISGWINKAITLFLPFIIRTVIIYILSAEYLGLNSLFSSILQVLNLTELGFSNAVVYSMYEPIASNNEKQICALLNFYKKVYFVIGIVILVVGIALIPFLDRLINGDVPDGINITVLYLIYLMNTVISYIFFAYRNALLNAFQRVDVINNIHTFSQGLMYCFQIIVLITTKNYYLYLVLMPIFTAVYNIITYVVSQKMYPKYICKGSLAKDVLASIKKQVSGLMVTKVCTITRNSFDSIFISAFLGLTVTAMYGNYYYIMNAVILLLNVISNGLLAGVGNSIALDSEEKNYHDMRMMNFVYMWLAGWCTICLLCLYQPFMSLWVGDSLKFPFYVAVAFCVYFYALEMGVVRSVYSDAAGLWWENRYRAIAESLTNLILNFVFVQLWGIIGIILATLVSLLIINFFFGSQIIYKYYFKNEKITQYFSDHGKYAFVTFLICLITYTFTSFITISGLFGLLLKAVLCIIIPNVFYILIYKHSKIYKEAIPWLLRVLHLERISKLLI